MVGGRCSGLSSEADPLCRQPSRLLPLLLNDNLELDLTEEDVKTVAGGQERGRQGDGWNEKSWNWSWIGNGHLSYAYQNYPQRRHPKWAVVYYSFGLRVRGEYETYWRDWKVDSQCVES